MNLQRKVDDLEAATVARLDAELDRLQVAFWQQAEETLTPAELEALHEFWHAVGEDPEREPAPAGAAVQEKIEATPETAEAFRRFVDVSNRLFQLRYGYTDAEWEEVRRAADVVRQAQPTRSRLLRKFAGGNR